MERSIIITDSDGTKYQGEIGYIESTHLGYEDHGIFTAQLGVQFASGGYTGLGGYCLDQSGATERQATLYGMEFIMKVMAAVGVSKWEDLTGKRIIALFPEDALVHHGFECVGIAHIAEDRIFNWKRHAEAAANA